MIINVENQDFLVYVNRFANCVQPLLCLEQLRPHRVHNLLKILGQPGKALEENLGEIGFVGINAIFVSE